MMYVRSFFLLSFHVHAHPFSRCDRRNCKPKGRAQKRPLFFVTRVRNMFSQTSIGMKRRSTTPASYDYAECCCFFPIQMCPGCYIHISRTNITMACSPSNRYSRLRKGLPYSNQKCMCSPFHKHPTYTDIAKITFI